MDTCDRRSGCGMIVTRGIHDVDLFNDGSLLASWQRDGTSLWAENFYGIEIAHLVVHTYFMLEEYYEHALLLLNIL